MFCIKCGNKIEENSRFCYNCGSLQQVTNTQKNTLSNMVYNLQFRKFSVVIAAIIAYLALIFLPLFNELYRYRAGLSYLKLRDADEVFKILGDSPRIWDGLKTVIVTILLILLVSSSIAVYGFFLQRKNISLHLLP